MCIGNSLYDEHWINICTLELSIFSYDSNLQIHWIFSAEIIYAFFAIITIITNCIDKMAVWLLFLFFMYLSFLVGYNV